MTSLLPTYNPFAPPMFPAAKPASINPVLAGRMPAPSYNTQLSPLDEFAYRQWVQQHNIPTDPNSTAPQDYDMRGFYQAAQNGDPRAVTSPNPNDGLIHYNDFWKTPLHQTFSGESQWSPANGPQWTPTDQLAQPNGQVVYDEQAQAAKRGGLLDLLGLK